jgi:uncharacterized protein (DUF1501 family)
MTKASRRGFLRQLFLASDTALAGSAARTLVCVFLRGGADTLNLVVPYGDDEYYALRPTISIPPPSRGSDKKDAALRLNDFYGFHPMLRPLLPIFEEGRLGIVQAVGSDNPTGSHFEAQDQMEHGEEYEKKLDGGWLGRHLSIRGARLTPLSAVAIGPIIPESLRGAPVTSALESLDDIRIKTASGNPLAVSQVLSAMYCAEVGIISDSGRETLDLLKRVEALRAEVYKAEGDAVYPDNDFGKGLREIARLIKADVGLEIACLDLGGWDTHFFQGTTAGAQAESIDALGRGLAAFDADLQGSRRQVTTLVMTEFGRRIYENSSLGTDHGRGFALMAMGNQINGGRIHGDWPGLAEEKGVGPGGLKVIYDYRSVLAEVLVGILDNREIDKVFPNFKPLPVGLVAHQVREGLSVQAGKIA